MKTLNLKIVLGALLAGVLAVFATGAVAKPIISWTPGQITETIEQGGSVTIPVTLTSTENVSGASLFVVPELEEFVSVSISDIQLLANVPQTVDINIVAPNNASPTDIQGTVHVRLGNKTVSRPLSVKISIMWETADGPFGSNFIYPSFGQNTAVEIESSPNLERVDIVLNDPASNSVSSAQMFILFEKNDSNQSLENWLGSVLPYSVELIGSGALRPFFGANGIQGYRSSPPLPQSSEFAQPIAEIYAVSPDQKYFIVAGFGNENRWYEFVDDNQTSRDLLLNSVESIRFAN